MKRPYILLIVSVADELGGNSLYVFQAVMDGYETQEKVFKEGFLQDASTAIPGSMHFDLKQKKTFAGGIGVKAGRAEESSTSKKVAPENNGS